MRCRRGSTRAGIEEYARTVLADPDRTDDFRGLAHELDLAAMDLDTCERIVLGGEGWDDVPISSAVRASTACRWSTAAPGQGRELVDGGIVSTTNVDTAVDAGAQLIVVVNPLVPYVNISQADPDAVFRVPRPPGVGHGLPEDRLPDVQAARPPAPARDGAALEGALPGRRLHPDRARRRRRADVPDEHPQLHVPAGRWRGPQLPLGDEKLAEDYDTLRDLRAARIEISATRVHKAVADIWTRSPSAPRRRILKQTTGTLLRASVNDYRRPSTALAGPRRSTKVKVKSGIEGGSAAGR